MKAVAMMDTLPSVGRILPPLAPAKSKITYDKAWNCFTALLTAGDTNKDGGS